MGVSSDSLRAAVRVSYLKSQRINTKVFFREYDSEADFTPIRDKTLNESIDTNFIYLDMEAKKFGKQFSKLISSGNYDFSDDLPIGYLLAIKLQHPDKALMSEIIKTVRANKFGCLSGNYTASCNLADPNPTDERAEQILGELVEAISIDLQSLSKTEIMICDSIGRKSTKYLKRKYKSLHQQQRHLHHHKAILSTAGQF